MSRRVYIETTVASYFTARPSRDVMVAGHQKATRELWPKFASFYEGYVSALVYEEAGRGDPAQAQMRLAALQPFRMLDIDEEARILAEKLIAGGGIPEQYPEDALPFTRVKVRRIVEDEGYLCPEICSPEELLEIDK